MIQDFVDAIEFYSGNISNNHLSNIYAEIQENYPILNIIGYSNHKYNLVVSKI